MVGWSFRALAIGMMATGIAQLMSPGPIWLRAIVMLGTFITVFLSGFIAGRVELLRR